MKLLVGLGNPGEKYKNNRHNVGHMFVNYLINGLTDSRINGLKLVKTQRYMNNSGHEIRDFVRNWKLEIRNLIVIHDDLDIPLGHFKIQKGSGPKLHNGINSIEQTLGTKDFLRVRIGIENRSPLRQGSAGQAGQVRIDGESYVLRDFTAEEKGIINATFPKILGRLDTLLFC